MIKTNNILSTVPDSLPNPEDSNVTVPNIFLQTGHIPAPLILAPTGPGGGGNAFGVSAEITQGPSASASTANLCTLNKGVYQIDWFFLTQFDFTLTPTSMLLSQCSLKLTPSGPTGGLVLCGSQILSAWGNQANGSHVVSLKEDGWILYISSVNTGVAQNCYVGAMAYIHQII